MGMGFSGGGGRGQGRAANLLRGGYAGTGVGKRSRAPVEGLVGKGAGEAPDLTALVEASDAIILCVTNADIASQIISDLCPSLRPGMMVVDTGTSRPETTQAMAANVAATGAAFVESPVTGGKPQAEAGELGALVGCAEEHFETVRPVLQAMCKTVLRFGEPGAGAAAKLANNYMVFGIAALIFEAFDRAEQAGVDWRQFFEVITCGSGDSGVLRRFFPKALEGDFKGYVFDVTGSLKDVSYYCQMSEAMGGVTPLAAAVRDIYETAVAEGHGDRMLSEMLLPELRGAGAVK